LSAAQIELQTGLGYQPIQSKKIGNRWNFKQVFAGQQEKASPYL
jgi:hypothetical protein